MTTESVKYSVPFWSLFRRVAKRTGHGDEELLSVYRDYGVIRKSDRDDNFNRPGKELNDYQLVTPGDLVLNKMKTWQGSLGISRYRGIVSPAYFVYESLSENDERYLNYVLRSEPHINYYAAHSKGIRVNQWDLQPEYLDQMRVVVPGVEAQHRIADYLDAETTQIDRMIAKLDEQVELLRERRNSVIRGQIQELLRTCDRRIQLGALAQFVSGSGFPHEYQGGTGGQYPFYKVGSLAMVDNEGNIEDYRNSVSAETAFKLNAEIIPAKSLLMAKIGEAMRLMRFRFNSGPCCIDNNMMALVINEDLADPKFVKFALTLVTIDYLINPGPVPSLNVQGFKGFQIPLPPLDEQRRIVAELDDKTVRIDHMIEKCNELRGLLSERRAALITAVVTGQKDV